MMNTRWDMMLPGIQEFQGQTIFEDIKNEVSRLEKKLNHYDTYSQISHINKNAFKEPVLLDDELFEIFSICNLVILFGWLLLLILPKWKYTQAIILNGLLVVFAIVYIFLLFQDINKISIDSFSTLAKGSLGRRWVGDTSATGKAVRDKNTLQQQTG